MVEGPFKSLLSLTSMNKIVEFSDRTFLIFDRGNFDEYCLYLVEANGERKPPRDIDYFTTLKEIAARHNAQSLYEDFISVFVRAHNEINQVNFEQIFRMSEKYGEDKLLVEKNLSILYCTMIAENKKAFTKLGKRIKRLGVHYLLLEGHTAYESANFMRGMKWREIDSMCRERGF